jgi:hypothetical protein
MRAELSAPAVAPPLHWSLTVEEKAGEKDRLALRLALLTWARYT